MRTGGINYFWDDAGPSVNWPLKKIPIWQACIFQFQHLMLASLISMLTFNHLTTLTSPRPFPLRALSVILSSWQGGCDPRLFYVTSHECLGKIDVWISRIWRLFRIILFPGTSGQLYREFFYFISFLCGQFRFFKITFKFVTHKRDKKNSFFILKKIYRNILDTDTKSLFLEL